MSRYKQCRECGADLGWNGRTFGTNECCCDNGYCVGCCGEERTTTTPAPAAAAPLAGYDGSGM